MKLTLPRALLILAALAAAVAGFYVARQIDRTSPQLASGTWFPQGWQVADFRLTDPYVLRIHALPGRVPHDAAAARPGAQGCGDPWPQGAVRLYRPAAPHT